jgi:hypothetical protein
MTNLLDCHRFPATDFGDLYHQRWRIEEAFKRLRHRLNLKHVSGLSQVAAMQDFAAKIVCDNLQALTTAAATIQFPILPTRRVDWSYAHTVLKPLMHSSALLPTFCVRPWRSLPDRPSSTNLDYPNQEKISQNRINRWRKNHAKVLSH